MSASFIQAPGRVSRVAGRAEDAETPDRALLGRFLADRDEAAFEQLVQRHGPKVLRVCRSRLGGGQDAEDAYQATFLLLASRGEAIRSPERVGAWLCGVARRVADRARRQAERRRRLEGASIDLLAVADRRPAADDLKPDLRAEIERLPEKYRRPIELCYWDGLSSEQAASMLDCPTGTLKWRLYQARENLRGRLGRAGVLLSMLLLSLRPGRTAEAAEDAALSPGDGHAPADGPDAERDRIRLARETTELASAVRSSPLLSKALGEAAGRSRILRRLIPLAVIGAATLAYLYAWSGTTLGHGSAPAGGPTASALSPTPAPAPTASSGGSCH